MKRYRFTYRTGTNRYDYRDYRGELSATSMEDAARKAQRRAAHRDAELLSVELMPDHTTY